MKLTLGTVFSIPYGDPSFHCTVGAVVPSLEDVMKNLELTRCARLPVVMNGVEGHWGCRVSC